MLVIFVLSRLFLNNLIIHIKIVFTCNKKITKTRYFKKKYFVLIYKFNFFLQQKAHRTNKEDVISNYPDKDSPSKTLTLFCKSI